MYKAGDRVKFQSREFFKSYIVDNSIEFMMDGLMFRYNIDSISELCNKIFTVSMTSPISETYYYIFLKDVKDIYPSEFFKKRNLTISIG